MRPLGQFFLLPCLLGCASGQPRWVEHVPRGHRYEYLVGSGSDSRYSRAREAAIAAAMARAAEATSVRIAVQRRDSTEMVETLDLRGGRGLSATRSHVGSLSVSATSPEIIAEDFEVVGEHARARRGTVDVWVLMRRPRPGGGNAPPGAIGLGLRSAILPGWGQFAKQQPRRGAAILGSVLLAIPSAVVADGMRADAELRARRAQTQVARTYWRDRANQLRTVEQGALAAGGLAYGFGILDAAAGRPSDYGMQLGHVGPWRIRGVVRVQRGSGW